MDESNSKEFLDINRISEQDKDNRLESILNEMEDVVWSVNYSDYKTIFITPSVEKLYGYSMDEWLRDNKLWEKVIHPDDREKVTIIFQKLEENGYYVSTHRIITSTGEIKWVTNKIRLIKDKNNHPVRLDGMVADVTAQKEAEIQLQTSESRLRAFLESQTNYVIRTDLEGRFTYTNKKYIDKFGYLHGFPDKSIIGQSRIDSVLPDDQSILMNVMQECINYPSKVFQVDLRKPLRDGSISVILWEFSCITDLDNNPLEIQCVGIDYTNRRSIEEELQRTTLLLNDAQRIAKMGAWDLDIETGKTYWTDEVYRIHELEKGFDHNKINGIEFYHPDHREKIIEALDKSISQKKSFDVLCKFITAKGNLKWVRASGYPILVKDKVTHIIGMFQDVTQTEIDKEMIKREQNFSRQILHKMSDGFAIINTEGEHIEVNEAFCKMTEFSREDLIGKAFPYPYWPESEMNMKNSYLEFYNSENRNNIEANFKKKTGEFMNVILSIDAVKNNENEPIFYFASILDITELKRAETIIKDNELRLNLAIDGTDAGLWDWNLKDNKVYFSPNWKKMLGYEDEDIENTVEGWKNLWHPEDTEAILKAIQDHLEEKTERYEVAHRLKAKNGKWVWILARGGIIRDAEKKPIRWVGTHINITKQKKMEEDLIKAKIQAESANRAKSDFLANMSHEIRTPLNAVIGFTGLLEKTELDYTQKEYVNTIASSAKSLLAIVNDILDFSKIEAGMLELDIVETDIVHLVESTVDIIKQNAFEKDIELVLDLPLNIDFKVFLDPVRLRQVLLNLFSNAIKFTDKGEVVFTLEYQKIDASQIELKFFVKDTGIGISEQQKSKLFKAFSQADSSITRRFGGTGLGLVISSLLLEKMDSEINFESEIGKGSIFYFSLIVGSEILKNEEKNNLLSKRILVIDDNQSSLHVIKKKLIQTGHEVFVHNNVLNGLQELKDSKIDLVFLDFQMPYFDGLETLQTIRKNLPDLKLDNFIILHSDINSAKSKLKEFSSERLTFLSKPIKIANYLDFSEGKFDFESKQEINLEYSLKVNYEDKFKILIVDDIKTNLLLAKSLMNRYFPQAIVYEATDGLQAIEICKSKELDLILMDIQMPRMDGIEATKRIRNLNLKNHVPIIAVSAGTLHVEIERTKSAGMDDFLSKPIDSIEFFNVLNKFIKIRL